MEQKKYSIDESSEHTIYIGLQNIMNIVRKMKNGTIVRSEKEKAELKTKAYGYLIKYKEFPEEFKDIFNFNVKGLEGMLALM